MFVIHQVKYYKYEGTYLEVTQWFRIWTNLNLYNFEKYQNIWKLSSSK